MREQGWEVALNDHIDNAPTFEWGRNDCAMWCGDWIRKATGRDFISPWRNRYATEQELNDLLDAEGFKTVEELADSIGLTVVGVAYAQRGDVVLHNGCLGICNGLYSLFLMEKGITRIETLRCAKAWKVE